MKTLRWSGADVLLFSNLFKQGALALDGCQKQLKLHQYCALVSGKFGALWQVAGSARSTATAHRRAASRW